jgi:hypothetical protein
VGSLVVAIEVCLKGYLQVEPTKDGVLREVVKPYPAGPTMYNRIMQQAILEFPPAKSTAL